ncbi:MAG: hypothetical protein U0X91_22225 [Spirosomataceae bacterium]
MMTELVLKPSKYWIYRLANRLEIRSTSANYLSHTVGDHHIFLHCTELEKEAWLFTGEVYWHHPLLTHKQGVTDYLTILLVKSEGKPAHYTSAHEKGKVSEKLTDALLFFGNEQCIDTEWPKDKTARFAALTFSKKWLTTALGNTNEADMTAFFTMLANHTGIYHPNTVPRFNNRWVNDFFQTDDRIASHLEIKSKYFQLIADFTEHLYRCSDIPPNFLET